MFDPVRESKNAAYSANRSAQLPPLIQPLAEAGPAVRAAIFELNSLYRGFDDVGRLLRAVNRLDLDQTAELGRTIVHFRDQSCPLTPKPIFIWACIEIAERLSCGEHGHRDAQSILDAAAGWSKDIGDRYMQLSTGLRQAEHYAEQGQSIRAVAELEKGAITMSELFAGSPALLLITAKKAQLFSELGWREQADDLRAEVQKALRALPSELRRAYSRSIAGIFEEPAGAQIERESAESTAEWYKLAALRQWFTGSSRRSPGRKETVPVEPAATARGTFSPDIKIAARWHRQGIDYLRRGYHREAAGKFLSAALRLDDAGTRWEELPVLSSIYADLAIAYDRLGNLEAADVYSAAALRITRRHYAYRAIKKALKTRIAVLSRMPGSWAERTELEQQLIGLVGENDADGPE